MTPPTTEWTDVLKRLESLERQNRRLKQIGASALVVIAALVLMGQTSARRTVEANEFILRDGAGGARARLFIEGPQDLESPTLALFDVGGTKRAELALSEGGAPAVGGGFPRLQFFDDQGYQRLSLWAAGTAGLEIAQPLTLIKELEPVISLQARSSGDVELSLIRSWTHSGNFP
ncbi:MAG: hypothetical protein A3H27_05285 [Acidobacteria bacterium RIFCSPLOWO2_02_FULL_59_13]|nr:MAG: hypothetical protein A3H27_05285 [Acidobacteria bacterium RIFCSPLOWO2_02_FULL_59_13]